jgi:hypothetical protein
MTYTSQNKNRQLTLDIFRSSLDNLDKSNRWVVLGDTLPWAELEKIYNSRLHNKDKGAGNKPARMIIAAMLVFGSRSVYQNPHQVFSVPLPYSSTVLGTKSVCSAFLSSAPFLPFSVCAYLMSSARLIAWVEDKPQRSSAAARR